MMYLNHLQWASAEAMESSIARLTSSKGESGTPSAPRSEHGGDLDSSSIMQPASVGPLQMTNQQVELAQEIAAFLKASHSSEGDKVCWPSLSVNGPEFHPAVQVVSCLRLSLISECIYHLLRRRSDQPLDNSWYICCELTTC